MIDRGDVVIQVQRGGKGVLLRTTVAHDDQTALNLTQAQCEQLIADLQAALL